MKVDLIASDPWTINSAFIEANLWRDYVPKPVRLKAEKRLAAEARSQARGREVVFHGTRYPRRILADQMLKGAAVGDEVVCFSRSPDMAAYWATSGRYDDDEETGAVLILDRVALRSRFRLVPYHDPGAHCDETEERVWRRDITPLGRFLVGIVWEGPTVAQWRETEAPPQVRAARAVPRPLPTDTRWAANRFLRENLRQQLLQVQTDKVADAMVKSDF